MPMIIQPESELGKELAKWDKPYTYQPFPKMLYRAQKINGKAVCLMGEPSQWGYRDVAEHQNAVLQAEAITKSNQLIVRSEDEMKKARESGWRESPQEALDHLEALEQEIGRAAAEANFGARRMSDLAQREHRVATDSTHEHVVDVKKPRRKHTRRSKATDVVAVTGSGEVPTE
jgi:hypothetical protein